MTLKIFPLSFALLAGAALCAAVGLLAPVRPVLAAFGEGELRLRVIDSETKQPLAFRMHVKTVRGKPVRPPRVPYWHDHFVADGAITFELKRGQYLFELECGPEYKNYTGHFEIQDHSNDERVVEMHRYVNLAEEGWWSGDLHVHRPPDDMQLLMRAEDLHVAAVASWRRDRTSWTAPKQPLQGVVEFDENRYFTDLAGEDLRSGGGLLYINLAQPPDLSGASADFPPSSQILVEAKREGDATVIAENAFWWDVPVWLASGRLDAMIVAGSHLQREGITDHEAWGKPRDRVLFPPPHGVGRWSERIYYHALECGLKLPPAAGSGSGVAENPLGYNRMYVYCGDDISWESWWQNFRAGRVFITNGPLLRTRVMGEPPGQVFRARKGDALSFEIALNLSTRERIDYLEIIKNGYPEHQVRLDQFQAAQGRLPRVEFTESGWFLVRVVTNQEKTYRYASTAPYYVEFDDTPRISRKSATFFRDWTLERARELNLADPEQQAEVLRYYKAAYDFWQEKVASANAD